MSKVKAISVFFPAYNEAVNIGLTVEKAVKFLPQIARHFEVLVINDGSLDKTASVVESLARRYPQVKLINHPKNLGYGAALKTGFYSCRFPLIAFTDADGQFDIRQLPKFLEKIKSCDLVAGFRIKRADTGIRLLNAKAWGLLMRLFFGVKVRDIDCGFKLVKKEVIDKISPLESEGALISAELLIKTQKAGFQICEVGVDHFPRKYGQQTGANLKVIIKAFRELIKLYPRLK